MLSILKYIVSKNRGLNIFKYLFIGVVFQIFKRITRSIISMKIFNGKNIYIYPNCNVSSMYAYTKIPDKDEIMTLRSLVLANGGGDIIFFDIGANIGSYSISMMDICDKIIAFEPHPYTVKRCKMNFLLNNISENNVKQLALSNETGRIHFSDYGGSSTINHILNDKNGIKVESLRLDDFVVQGSFKKSSKYIIKVDVEGYEEQVFEGGMDFLTNYPVLGIIFECVSNDKVFELLNSYGYINIKKLSEHNYFAKKD